jgi:uncharacterized membrane protein
MIISIFLITVAFIIVLLSATPFLLKQTIAFGVTIPEGHTDNPTLASFKKMYSIITLVVGVISLICYFIWYKSVSPSEDTFVLVGMAIQFGILFVSMVLYFLFHAKTTQLKRNNNWGANLKQVRVTELTIRAKDEMLPWYFFTIPMLITIGLIAYTSTHYASLPDLIPTHWGPNGQPDAFSAKTPFSVIALLLILLVMQGMMLGINSVTKQSGIKLSATKRKSSSVQQLSFRKYSSWLLFVTTVLMTVLFGFLQLSTIHENIGNTVLMLVMPLGFLFITLFVTAIYAFKVGQGGSRISVALEDDLLPGITDVDDDQYWKAGVFYVNKNDPSIFVEKRFGVGWTINFANPVGYLVLFLPIIIIVVITFLL